MSRTTMWIADQSGRMSPGPEFSNAWRSAAAVWEHLGKRWGHTTGTRPILMQQKVLAALWHDAGNAERPWYERVVLACTFDRVLIRREEFVVIADCMERMAQEMSGPQSLSEQAASLRTLAADEGVKALGWQQTSVSEKPWWVHSEQEERGRAYVIGEDNGAAWVMDLVGPRPPEET